MITVTTGMSPLVSLPRPVVLGPLQCIASYYSSEDQARSALARVRAELGQMRMQSGLERPDDADSLRLSWRSRRWLGLWPFAVGTTVLAFGLAVCIAGLFGLGVYAFWWTLELVLAEPSPGVGSIWLLLLVTLLGACTCVALALAGRGQMMPSNRFARHVRRQLARGNWAVVVHDIPMPHQAAVLALMQDGCTDWSAAARAIRRL